nr:GNAT family N-acetyltransferase [uncultured Bacillus sp.]
MIIEKLIQEDIPELLELYENFIPFALSEEQSVLHYHGMLQDDNYFLAVAKEGETIIGSALGICCKSLAVPFLVVEDVIVKEEWRGKGVGKKLMSFLDELAKSKHCAYAILVSSAFRIGAHQFYESIGYTDSVTGFRKVY